ncbi:MAG: hypothetical protein FWC60_01485 [Firmicutes bacterium]|nr:hypothetical protein [Bacillota bacterium]
MDTQKALLDAGFSDMAYNNYNVGDTVIGDDGQTWTVYAVPTPSEESTGFYGVALSRQEDSSSSIH